MEVIDFIKEDMFVECKGAKGGFPSSFWETYSAFANTKGGTVYLGIEEIRKGVFVSAMLSEKEIDELQSKLWSLLNNPQKVSVNLLSSEDVSLCLYDGYPAIKIVVKPAKREYRPVYINGNLLGGSYRRNHDGDYHCTPQEIKGMLRDSDEKPQDLLCLEELGLDVLCQDTVSSYMNRLSAIHPDHVFLEGGQEKFLERIGAIRLGSDGKLHPTRAGLLMFGYDYKIVYEYPDYFLDYQEHKEDGPSIRWTERITSDLGLWSGNLYDFYIKISNKITADLPTPFKMEGITRIDETDLHASLREALCNAISNADFYQRGGLVIHNYGTRIELSNPGSMRVTLEQAYKGGESDARNKTILKMFNLIGVGERAGSGIPKILSSSKAHGYREPEILESFNPDRTKLIVYLCKDEAPKLDEQSDESVHSGLFEQRKKMVLAFLNANGESTSREIAESLRISPSSTKNVLRALADEGLLTAKGANKNRKYVLAK